MIWFTFRKDTYGVFSEPVDPEEVCLVLYDCVMWKAQVLFGLIG